MTAGEGKGKPETKLPRDFGRYVLTDLIGEGGMAEVFRASVRVAEGLTKWVVIKKIRSEFADREDFTRMFVDEAKIALSLNHANIVQVFDFGQIDGTFYLAMELVEGMDLMQLFHTVHRQHEHFPPVIAAYVGHQVASGLTYAHRKKDEYDRPLGIVHRDVSPHNVMLSYDGQVKILDFGIARTKREFRHSQSFASDERETIKGKVAYMSPEQAAGKALDRRSDIYSLGVVLYELLTGELLFRNLDRDDALFEVRKTRIPPLLEKSPDLPIELVRIVDRALSRDPAKRYPKAREMQADLAAFLHHSEPLVDDEVLSDYIQKHRQLAQVQSFKREAQQQNIATREIGESLDNAPSQQTKSVRLTLLQAVFRSPSGLQLNHRAHENDDSKEFDEKTKKLLDFVNDLAFKQEAQVKGLSSGGATLILGAPVPVGDEVKRAIRFARALQERVNEVGAGIGLGLFLTNTRLSVTQHDSGNIDIEVPEALANHLDQIANKVVDQEILVSSDLSESLSRTWRFGPIRELDPVVPPQWAGRPWAADLQKVTPLLGPLSFAERRARNGTTSPVGRRRLFGRDLELKTLRDSFADALRRSTSHGVLVIGDHGLGKGALLQRFVSSIPSASCSILRGVGQWTSRNQGLGLAYRMLSRFLELGRQPSLELVQSKLKAYDLRDSDRMAQALVALSGFDGQGIEGKESIDSGAPSQEKLQGQRGDQASKVDDPGLSLNQDPLEIRERITQLVKRLIRTLAQQNPVLVVIESLHFADEASLSIFTEFFESKVDAPILGLASITPGPRARAIQEKRSMEVIELRELDEQSRREMILGRFEKPEEANELADAILARAGGNPLFIEEILSSLMTRGIIKWDAQRQFFRLRQRNAAIDLPPSIGDAIATRLNALPSRQREVLHGASILGRSFRPNELQQLLGFDAQPEISALIGQQLIEEGLTPAGTGTEIREVRFSTVSLHKVCRQSVPPTLLCELHSKAADIKRNRKDYNSSMDDGPIAEHLLGAGRKDEAIAYARSAAKNAEKVGANDEAYYFLTQTLKAIDDDEDQLRFDLLEQREEILRVWGRRRAQGADIRQMIRCAEQLGDPHKQVVAAIRLLRFYLECGRTHRAIRLIPRLRQRIDELDSQRPPCLVELAELESELLISRGHLPEAENVAADALPSCDQCEHPAEKRATLLLKVGQAQMARGLNTDAYTSFDEALQLAKNCGQRRLEAEVLNRLGEATGKTGDYQEAVRFFQAALKIDKELGDRFSTGIKLANLGLTYAEIGLYRRAERHLRKALELHEAIGQPVLLTDVVVNLGEVAARLGDFKNARSLLREGSEVADRLGDLRTHLRAEVRLASTWVLEAEKLLEAGSDATAPTTNQVLSQLLRQAEDGALSVLQPSRNRNLRTTATRALHILSQVETLRGNIPKAIEYERDAVELFNAGAAPRDGVITLYHLGILLRDSATPGSPELKEEGQNYIDRAATIVRQRLERLHDEDLRAGYLRHPQARSILRDARE